MFRRIGQPVNMRYRGVNKVIPKEISKEWQNITRIVQFGQKHGYKATIIQ